DLVEAACDRVPDREILICGESRVVFKDLDARANRLANYLHSIGIEAGQHIGIYAQNCVEWVEAMLAAYKIRAVPINVNYRYVEDELHYIFDNADLVALIFHREYADRAANIQERLPKLKSYIAFGEGNEADCEKLGAVDYEEALAKSSPERKFEVRSGDDSYMLYTGGTTGMPKGVMWKQVDIIFALGGAIDPYTSVRAEKPEDMQDKIKADGEGMLRQLPMAPLMHGAAQWNVLSQLFIGNPCFMLPGGFEAHKCWEIVEREGINAIMITGDATARPLMDALKEKKYPIPSLAVIVSSAAIFSPSVKLEFLEYKEGLILMDATGSSEQGMTGKLMVTREGLLQEIEEKKQGHVEKSRGVKIAPGPDVAVLDENWNTISAGSDVIGKLARSGNIPSGYYKDPVKSAETFISDPNGKRWSVAGDLACVEADGTIVMLGRGSTSINSGGEKIYPEEVEGALKSHPAVFDALVVGVPDERWGQRVAAVVQCRAGESVNLDEVDAHCRKHVAGYKVPRELHIVEQVKRAPSGKPDYRWAKEMAEEGGSKVS
ncbi:MAG: acyl-CoA synthetase, partial [Deltaproteobacteria bacterium]|nr:acyl-CoA synthetase [Deltaproteobacteria bacterium]